MTATIVPPASTPEADVRRVANQYLTRGASC